MIPQIILGGKMCKVIHHTPQRKIDSAMSTMKDALADKFGFCYKSVKRIPLHTGRELRAEMVRLKLERMNVNLHKDGTQLAVITEKLAELRTAEKEHYQYDETAYKTLRRNYDRLKAALVLLHREGYIKSYTLQPSGNLVVTEFSTYNKCDITTMIDQSPAPYCDYITSVHPPSTAKADLKGKRDVRRGKHNPKRKHAYDKVGDKLNAPMDGEQVRVVPGGGDMDSYYYTVQNEKPHPTYEKYFKLVEGK